MLTSVEPARILQAVAPFNALFAVCSSRDLSLPHSCNAPRPPDSSCMPTATGTSRLAQWLQTQTLQCRAFAVLLECMSQGWHVGYEAFVNWACVHHPIPNLDSSAAIYYLPISSRFRCNLTKQGLRQLAGQLFHEHLTGSPDSVAACCSKSSFGGHGDAGFSAGGRSRSEEP